MTKNLILPLLIVFFSTSLVWATTPVATGEDPNLRRPPQGATEAGSPDVEAIGCPACKKFSDAQLRDNTAATQGNLNQAPTPPRKGRR